MDPNSRYWEKIEQTWENPRSPEPTHFEYWQRLDTTWKHILSYPPEALTAMRQEWSAFEKKRSKHASCPSTALCGACGTGYCEHLHGEHICLSYTVCTVCDTGCFPNPYNPRCRWLIEYYTRTKGFLSPEIQEILKTPVQKVSVVATSASDNRDLAEGIEVDGLDSTHTEWRNLIVPRIKKRQPALHVSDGANSCADTPFPKEWGW